MLSGLALRTQHRQRSILLLPGLPWPTVQVRAGLQQALELVAADEAAAKAEGGGGDEAQAQAGDATETAKPDPAAVAEAVEAALFTLHGEHKSGVDVLCSRGPCAFQLRDPRTPTPTPPPPPPAPPRFAPTPPSRHCTWGSECSLTFVAVLTSRSFHPPTPPLLAGGVTREYKQKFQSLRFNLKVRRRPAGQQQLSTCVHTLRSCTGWHAQVLMLTCTWCPAQDPHNPDLRAHVLRGEIQPDVFVRMTATELASKVGDCLKQSIKNIDNWFKSG